MKIPAKLKSREPLDDCDPWPFIWLLIRVVSLSLSGTESVRPRLVVICMRRVFGRVKLIYEVKLICAEPFCASPVRRVH